MRNLVWLISLVFLFSGTVESSSELTPEEHYRIAKEAYANNQCEVAITHFDIFLATSKQLKADKKESITSAISWCKKYLTKNLEYILKKYEGYTGSMRKIDDSGQNATR